MLQAEALRAFPLFARWSDDQIDWLLERASEMRLKSGEVLYTENEPAQHFYVLLEGAIQISRMMGGEAVPLYDYEPGAFTGEFALLNNMPYPTTARTTRPSRLLKMDAATFDEMVTSDRFPIANEMLRVMAKRVLNVDSLYHEREKLLKFQMVARHLTHNLNNPAAAAGRAASHLRNNFDALGSLALKLSGAAGDSARVQSLTDLQTRLMSSAPSVEPLDPVEQSDREEEITDWLDERNIPEGWKLAPALVRAGLTADRMDELADSIGEDTLADALQWMGMTVETSDLLETIEEAMARISTLLLEFRNSYSMTDQAPLKEIDIHEGLDSTLTVFRQKLREGVDVTRRYDHTLPRIWAYADELNQVWTNLIANAIDAMNGKGKLELRTARDGDYVVVEVVDNGPGIPAKFKSRVFKPYATTKSKTGGTGLGLNSSQHIIRDRHHGDISFESRPGETRFIVRLPVTRPSAEDAAARDKVDKGPGLPVSRVGSTGPL